MLAIGLCTSLFGQTIMVLDNETSEPLIGAVVSFPTLEKHAVTDVSGKAIFNEIPLGKYKMRIRYIGYEQHEGTITVSSSQTPIEIRLMPDVTALGEVTISITRSGRTIENVPTRVEMIDEEELVEKAVMNSANIAILLKESTGIQVQQTSASTASKTIRIQGLDGRHTQIVKDGFPLYGGFSGGLSIMQIPPLDLKRVEVIKGSSSTLYGGGAIAGVVNLVSKTPSEEPELELMIDQTSALRTTLNTFYSARKNKIGWTLYASGNTQKVYDVDNDHFSEIPETQGININPSLFWKINNDTKLRFTVNSNIERRLGGDLQVVQSDADTDHSFSNKNLSQRLSYQINFDHWLNDSTKLNIKNSLAFFNRSLEIPDFTFEGNQWVSFSELSYTTFSDKSEWILGANFYSDYFNETSINANNRDYGNSTAGAFAQYNRSLTNKFTLEGGLRSDYNTEHGLFLLPRISLIYKLNESISTRFGGGLGYKTPTVFTEETELINFEGLQALDNGLESEQSKGLNLDVNYTKTLGDNWSFSANQLFFLTQLDHALILDENTDNTYSLTNANDAVISTGMETNLKIGYKDLKLFMNYALTNTKLRYDGNRQKALTPKHSIGTVLVYEVEDKWRIGYEMYYTSSQYLSDNTLTNDFAEMGLMIMRKFNNLSLYVNFENFTDTRQSNFEQVSFGEHTDPQFREIWAPTEGRVINGGIILKL